ncbi:AraC family transcriptional regulator [Paenibacillus sp. FSL K6-1230]|uniref:AraC family transcriptional regulator n=1 Tax=Paenibacillus sp. FSL K6-1230 TaxID=2921603 RepID=UPI0030F61F80
MKLRSLSYLWKLLLFSVVLGTLPVIVLGALSYYNSSLTVQKNVNRGNELLLQQTQMGVEQMLRTIDNSATQFLQSSVVSHAFNKEITNQDFEMVHELYKGIATIQTYELGIKEIYLISLSREWMVSGTGVNEYSSPDFMPQMESFAREQTGSFWIRDKNSTSHTSESVFFVKKYPFNAANPKGIISVALSPDAIARRLSLQDNKLGNAFIMDHEFKLLHQRDDGSAPGHNLSAEPSLQPIKEATTSTGQYVSKQEGESVTVTYRKSSYNGWIYVSVASNEQVNEQNQMIGWMTLLVCFLILLITLFLAWIGSRRMYSPIRAINTALADVAVTADPKESVGELQAIGERVHFLLRNQSRITNELQGQQTQLKEFFMHKLFSGEISNDDFVEKLSWYGWKCPWPTMSLLAIQIDTLEDTRYEEGNRDLLMFAINNMVEELVPAEQRLLPVVRADSQVTLIGTDQQGEMLKAQLFKMSSAIQAAISQYLNISVSIGISRPFYMFSAAQQAMYEATTALKFSAGLGEQTILFIEDVQPQKGDLSLFPQDKEQSLFDAVRSGDLSLAEVELKHFIEALFSAHAPFQDYHLSLLRLLVSFLKFGQELSLPMERIGEDEALLVHELFRLRNTREMEQWFWSLFVQPYTLELESRRSHQFKQISESIIDMIHREFDTELTLEYCSSRIHYHPHYVSRVFRQETGVNFGEYLTSYRMEMAKVWLKETDMKIAEIAKRLQYNNSANFIRSFRKIMGTTPGKYREGL